MTCRQLDYKTLIYFHLFLLTSLVGCIIKPKESTKWSEETHMMSYDSISVYPYLFQGNFFLKNESLVMIDPMNAGEISVLDLNTSQMMHYSMSDSLQGINHALFPVSFYHFNSGKYYCYLFEYDNIKLYSQNLRFRGNTINRAVQLNENIYLTLGFFSKLLGLYNNKVKRMEYYGHYPFSVQIPSERKAKNQIAQSFQGEIAYSEEHSRIVYCSRNFAYMSCYRFVKNKLIFDWQQNIIALPQVSIVKGNIKYDRISPSGGFTNVITSGDYIFACYEQSDSTDPVSNTYNILVYDINGNHITTYDVDHPLLAIAVNLEEKAIYGIMRKDDTVGFAPFINVIVRFRFENVSIQK